MATLFVAIPGWGAPNLGKKREILSNNLQAIARGPWGDITIRIFQYDTSVAATIALTEALRAAPRGAVTEIVPGPGIVGDFLRTAVCPEDPAVSRADAVLLLLDDVELQPSVDFAAAMKLLRDFGPAVIVPALTADSLHVFPHMIQRPEPFQEFHTVTVTPVAEFFAYLMDTVSYARYHSFLSPDNPWMWGADLILTRRMGLRVLLLNAMTVRHHFRGSGDATETFAQRARFLASHGETEQDVAAQPSALYTILAPVTPAPART